MTDHVNRRPWVFGDVYGANPLRVRMAHRTQGWRAVVRRCSCGQRLPCPGGKYVDRVLSGSSMRVADPPIVTSQRKETTLMLSHVNARMINDPICPPAAVFPLDMPYRADGAERGLTITYVNPTTAKVDDQTNYVEE